jgi:predicted peptidase
MGKQVKQTLKANYIKEVTMDYLLYLPKDYDTKAKVPLVLFLHGAGERGNDIEKVKIHGLPKLIEAGKEFPFMVVSPQCPLDVRWETKDLIALLDYIEANYKVDKDKIYVTGLSMGGNGTWRLVSEIPDRIAAAIPICGWGDPFAVCNMKNVAVWAFHGAKDNVVPIAGTEELVNRLKACGGEVEYKVYPDAWHDSWTVTYDNDKIYDWLLSHSRKK